MKWADSLKFGLAVFFKSKPFQTHFSLFFDLKNQIWILDALQKIFYEKTNCQIFNKVTQNIEGHFIFFCFSI
jgi:hypothetical protein